MFNSFFIQPNFSPPGEEGSEVGQSEAEVVEEKASAPLHEDVKEEDNADTGTQDTDDGEASGKGPDDAATDEKDAEAKSEDDKEEKTDDEPAPLTLEDLTVPDGMELDPDMSKDFLSILDNKELSTAEKANALLSLQDKAMNNAAEGLSGIWAETQKEWKAEVTADVDIGGDKLETTLAGVSQLIDKYGDDKTREMFDITGSGNRVEMLRFLNNIANDLALEGGPVSGSPTSGGGSKTQAERLYPTTSP